MVGGDRRSEEFSNPQNENLKSGRVSQHIADELNIGRATVERSEYFVDDFEKIKEIDPNEAENIRKGKSKRTKIAVRNLRKAEGL